MSPSNGSSLVIETSEGQWVTVAISTSTKISREVSGSLDDIHDGTQVLVESTEANGTIVDFIVAGVPQLRSVVSIAANKTTAIDVNLGRGPAATCTGSGRLSTEMGNGGRAHSVVLARGSFVIAARRTKMLSLTKTGAGNRFVKGQAG